MTSNQLTFGSLFAGIGGFDLGFERAGMVCKWQVEKDPFCQKVLAKHWPNVRRYEDVKEVGKHNLETVDVLCGGFPCQPHSYAGKRKASEDERDLWGDFARVIGEIKPQWIVAENVPGLLTSENGRYFGNVLRDLASIGYDAEWEHIPAAAIGSPHIRARVFIVAYPGGKPESFRFFGGHCNQNLEWEVSPEKWSQDRSFLKVGTSITKGVPIYKEGISFPTFPKLVDGVPSLLDEIRGLGNAVVPQVAYFIATLLIRATNNNFQPELKSWPLIEVHEQSKLEI